MNKKAILEGLLFIVGDEGLTLEQISEILEVDKEEARELLMILKKDYEDDNRGIRINFLGNSFKLTTKPEHKEYYRRLIESEHNHKLSQQALEILAIIVYNEPITRVEIDRIRGVYSGWLLKKLVARGFVKEVGRSDLPGRPILYKTTNEFLDYLGLASKDELPRLEISNEENEQEEVDLFLSRYREEV